VNKDCLTKMVGNICGFPFLFMAITVLQAVEGVQPSFSIIGHGRKPLQDNVDAK
jgi:hypothetical protein